MSPPILLEKSVHVEPGDPSDHNKHIGTQNVSLNGGKAGVSQLNSYIHPTSTDSRYREIPHYTYSTQSHDPIEVAETNYSQGKPAGAIKITLEPVKEPSSALKNFTFRLDRTVINPDPIVQKLLFYKRISTPLNIADLTVDGKFIDLYRLYHLVHSLTDRQKLETAFGVKTSLKPLYDKYLRDIDENVINGNGKRVRSYIQSPNKKYKRSVELFSSKGFRLSKPTQAKVSSPSQLNMYVKKLLLNSSEIDDDTYSWCGETSSLSEFIQQDSTLFGDGVSLADLEKKYWEFVREGTLILDQGTFTHILTSKEDVLDVWNLENIPYLPNSLFNVLSPDDINNNLFITPSVKLGKSFTTEDWHCEDHFSQSIHHQIVGYKRWFFIPESSFQKFETLLHSFKIDQLDDQSILDIFSGDNTPPVEILRSYLKSNCSDVRLKHKNALFQKLIEKTSKPQYQHSAFISPEVLEENDIEFYTTLQKPGEYIIKYPKTYAFNVSYGVCVSKEVNFASSLWLSYAFEGEKWLYKNGVIPNFSVFRLLATLASYADSSSKVLTFDDSTLKRITEMVKILAEGELSLREKVRSKASIPERYDENYDKIDAISDDDLTNVYPSKIVLTDLITKEQMIVSLPTFIESELVDSNIKAEMYVALLDLKLKQLCNPTLTFNDCEAWVEKYKNLETEESLPLKNYKLFYNEGEKIISNIESSVVYSMFLGKQISALYRSFLESMELMKAFIEKANDFVDECQSLLSIKHQQRTRNINEVDNTLLDPKEILPKLYKLIDLIPTLNFDCPEIDQILEFKAEIEDFERACRLLISQPNPSLREFNDLINFGKSFGIRLKSLEFLIRIKNKVQWISTYETIVSGGDPFGDKKDIFTLGNLEDFYNQGLTVLGSKDVDKIAMIEQILKNSYAVSAKIEIYLSSDRINESTSAQIDIFIDDIDDRVKLKSDKRIFVDLSKFDKLLDYKTSLETLKKLYDFKKSLQSGTLYDYEDVKKLRQELLDTKLPISNKDWKIIDGPIDAMNKFLNKCLKNFDKIRLFTTNDFQFKNIGSKVTISKDLLVVLQKFLTKCNINLTFDDTYLRSSSKLYQLDDEYADELGSFQQIYCLCREYEFGSMVECDKCKEWYHDKCVKRDEDTRNKKQEEVTDEEDSFICPICKLVSSERNSDEFLSSQVTHLELFKLVRDVTKLKVRPTDEYEKLIELLDTVNKFSSYYFHEVVKVKQSDWTTTERVDRLYFILRKVYGSAILIEDLFYEVITSIRAYEYELSEEKDESLTQEQTQDTSVTESPTMNFVNYSPTTSNDTLSHNVSIDEVVKESGEHEQPLFVTLHLQAPKEETQHEEPTQESKPEQDQTVSGEHVETVKREEPEEFEHSTEPSTEKLTEEPTEPSSVNPTERSTQPTVPIEPTQPTAPTEPTAPTAPTQHTQPTGHLPLSHSERTETNLFEAGNEDYQ